MTIHHTDPFATPDEHKSPARRLRGRLPAAVTLWTSPGPGGPVGTAGAPGPTGSGGPAGLTVSSTVVADGDPPHVLGLIDEESDLWAAVAAGGVFAVIALTPDDRQLADRFAGLMPAPGGLFQGHRWRQTPFGPVPEEARSWAGCRLVGSRPMGWSLLVEAVIERAELADTEPLVHHRGRYLTLSRR